MTIDETLSYIHSVSWLGSVPGLERICELLHRLGDPQLKIPAVHIAGTNGKGSTASTLSSILTKAGYRVGMCTSPYILSFNERMQICGENITDEELCEITEMVRPHADAMENSPTEFELVAAITFMYFAHKNCDIIIIECGMGGRMDATNVFTAPVCSIIMNIGLDHVNELGNTLSAIAKEKAGIIKDNCPTILYSQTAEVHSTVEAVCSEKNSALHISDLSSLSITDETILATQFDYKGKRYKTSLLGAHQAKNAAVAIEAIEVLRARGFAISDEALLAGMANVSWPARFEVLSQSPWFILDGGHNPQCAETVVHNLQTYFSGKKIVILTGVLADKDYNSLTDILNTVAHCYVATAPYYPRALSAEKYAEHLAKYNKPVYMCPTIAEAVSAAMNMAYEDTVICAVGSLYMAGDIHQCF